MKFSGLKNYKQGSKSINKKNKKHQNLNNLDSSSDTSPTAPSLTRSTSQTVITTPPRKVTLPPTGPISNIFDTSSTRSSSTSSTTNRPPTSELPITSLTQLQPSPIHTPLVHVPNPYSVAKYINNKQQKLGTAIKTARIQPQLGIVHISEPTYSTDLESSTRSHTSPTLKPHKKLSTSLSSLLDNYSTQEYKRSQDSNGTLFKPQHRYNLRPLPYRRLSTDTSTLLNSFHVLILRLL